MMFSCIFLRTAKYEFFVLRHFNILHSSTCRFISTSSDLFSAVSSFPEISQILCDENRRRCLDKFKSFKPISPRKVPPETSKSAAVLVPLCIVNNELSLLYTLRKSDLKRHRGQVSFPGGVQDESDIDLIETALRETEEELGISRQSVKVWGPGSPILGIEFTVLPVIGFLGPIDVGELKPNPDEVELPFTVTLRHFCQFNNCAYTQFKMGDRGYTLPVYINAERRIWGITALITHLLLTCLIPQHYNHSVKYIKSVRYKEPVL